MVDPGHVFSTDFILPGVSNRQLRFAALSPQSAVVVYLQSGFADVVCATVLDFRAKAYWSTALRDDRLYDLEGLRQDVMGKQYRPDNRLCETTMLGSGD